MPQNSVRNYAEKMCTKFSKDSCRILRFRCPQIQKRFLRKTVGNFDKKRFSSTSGRKDTQHKGISLYLILPSDHTTFTRGHSDESAPFVKLWFLKRNPLTFLPRSSSEVVTSEYVGYKALYIETEIKNISFVGLPDCTNVPSKHVLLKSHEFFYHMYIKSTPQIL